jgi:8-oxo-dGTP diphosphatase
MDRGLRLIQLREKDWPEARQHALADALLERALPYRARLLFNGDATRARAWGCHGVHWTSAVLAAATVRPPEILCAASCHSRDDLARAGALQLDFAVLGPVRPTPTHPNSPALGWDGFAALAADTLLPVYALGGMEQADLGAAIVHGAHGIALRRAAWPQRPGSARLATLGG